MSNMSYCRFQNTLSDMHDCRQAMNRLVDGEEQPLSREEAVAAAQLAKLCLEFATDICEAADLDYPLKIERLKLSDAVMQINGHAIDNRVDEDE